MHKMILCRGHNSLNKICFRASGPPLIWAERVFVATKLSLFLRSLKKHFGSLKLFSHCQTLLTQNAALYMTLSCAPRSYLSETLFTLFSNESNVQKVYTCFVSMNTGHRMCRVRCICAVQRASSKLSITAGWPSLWNHSPQSVKLLLENLPKTRH